MTSHVWVRHTIMPISISEVILNPEEGEIWFQYTHTQEAEEASLEEAAYGCDLCGIPLTPPTFSTDCKGVPNDIEALLSP